MEINNITEHERNINHGKRSGQLESSAKNFIIGIAVIIAIVFILVIAKSLNII